MHRLLLCLLALAFAAPGGGLAARDHDYSFESACTDIARDQSNISARCPNLRGEMVATQIDAAGCNADIVNSNGHLTCLNGGRSRPPGPSVTAGPTSCSVGDVAKCNGCAITCGGGKQAICKTGSTYYDSQDCAFSSNCYCK